MSELARDLFLITGACVCIGLAIGIVALLIGYNISKRCDY